jgi:hypothetical protein
MFEDESMIRDYQTLQMTWFAIGKQRVIKTTGKHRGVKLLATLDYAEGKVVWKEDEQYNAESFLAFLEQVLAAYPTGRSLWYCTMLEFITRSCFQAFFTKIRIVLN